jgi:hypothetical protein
MFDKLTLTNCPEKFALNCKNYEINCHTCKGNSTSKYLLYKPIDNSIDNHPANIVQKSKVVSYASKGKSKERKLIKAIPFLNNTVASGAVAGDGDAYIILNNIGKLRVEIKCRFTSKTNIGPTLKEFREGGTQKIVVYLIHNVKQNKTYFYLTYFLFVQIWSVYIKQSFKHHCNFTDPPTKEKMLYSNNACNCFRPYKNSSLYWFNIVSEFVKFKNLGLGNSYYETDKLFILKNKAGVYVGCTEEVFTNLIDLYQSLTK